jgi:predicted NUDIX family NTP pyrophosphohydrolase
VAGKRSGGILVFRRTSGQVEVLIGHMGGPFWARKDTAAWSIPKGEIDEDEQPLAAARREFAEELGLAPPAGDPIDLGEVRQSGGKLVSVWAIEGDLDPADVVPGTFQVEWPPRSGQLREFPELDRVEWLDVDTAADKLVTAQRVFLDRLTASLHN